MQELRIVLIIVGVIAIAGLLAHGFWSNRRNRPERLLDRSSKRKRRRKESATSADFDADPADATDDDFDDLGVSEVRVVSHRSEPTKTRQEPAIHFDESSDDLSDEAPAFVMADAPEEKVSEPEPVAPASETVTEPAQAEPVAEPAEPDDVYVLNVIAAEGEQFVGSELAPCLTSLGLEFGEMSIYHRHLQPNGQGGIIYSVANMVKPGTFDPEHMDEFQTHGLSLFMTVPCKGEPSRNFNVMYNAAQRIVSELGGVLLDGHRNPFTAQTLQHYQQRIREYERQQLLQQQ